MHQPLAAVAPSVNALRVARDLTPVGEDVVAPAERGIYSERAEVAYYRGGKARKIYSAAAVGADEGEVYVAEIVEHRTAAGHPTDDPNRIFADEGRVYFRPCVLIFSDNDRAVVSPQHENIVVRIFKQVFLGGEIEILIV